MKIFNNIHDAYIEVLKDVYDNPEFTSSPRGMKIREIMHYQFRVENPKSESIVTKDKDRNKIINSYTEKELKWYKSGSLLVEDASKISSFWKNVANSDGTINSNYGYLVEQDASEGNPLYEFAGAEFIPAEVNHGMRTPKQWVKESLLKDKDSDKLY